MAPLRAMLAIAAVAALLRPAPPCCCRTAAAEKPPAAPRQPTCPHCGSDGLGGAAECSAAEGRCDSCPCDVRADDRLKQVIDRERQPVASPPVVLDVPRVRTAITVRRPTPAPFRRKVRLHVVHCRWLC